MNLLELKSKVIEKLKERSTPKYWPESEITDNINRGCRKFAADTKCKDSTVKLAALDVYNAFFKFPARLMAPTGVYWKGKKLVRTTAGYLDDYFSGYTDQMKIGEIPALSADWRTATEDLPTHWMVEDGKIKLYPIPKVIKNAPCRFTQSATLIAGETEIFLSQAIPANKLAVDVYANGVYQNKDQWEIVYGNVIEMNGPFIRDQHIEIVWVSAADRTAQYTTLIAGNTSIALSDAIPTDQSYVDLYLNGLYQNKDQWSIANANQINIVSAMARDQKVEVVYYPAAPFAEFSAIKKTFTLTAGEDTITLPVSYPTGTNAAAVILDGISQAPSTFTETDQRTITLSAPVTRNKSVEIVIFKYGGFECSLKGTFIPASMTADSDLPDLPDHLEYYHDAIWQWALVECYSREGQQRDPSLAQLYASMYREKLDEYKTAFDPPVEFLPRDPWKV